MWMAHDASSSHCPSWMVNWCGAGERASAAAGQPLVASVPNDPVAMAEPLHFQEAKAVIDKVMQLFPAPAVFFYETDEVRGINRDSRSAKLGLNNAELLARDMNALAGFVRANDPAVMPLFWCELLYSFRVLPNPYRYLLTRSN